MSTGVYEFNSVSMNDLCDAWLKIHDGKDGWYICGRHKFTPHLICEPIFGVTFHDFFDAQIRLVNRINAAYEEISRFYSAAKIYVYFCILTPEI